MRSYRFENGSGKPLDELLILRGALSITQLTLKISLKMTYCNNLAKYLTASFLLTALPAMILSTAKAEELVAKQRSSDGEQWIQLFNGKNLDGWIPKIRFHEMGENFGNTFRVEDGILTVGYEAYDEFNETFGHLFYKDSFSHYRLRVEYRFVGEQCKGGPGWALRNSGLMLHGEKPSAMAKDQDFPTSIEVQLLGGDGKNARTNANLCTPGTNVVMEEKLIKAHCTKSDSETYHGQQWVTVEVEVRGSEVIRHWINGKVVLEYDKPQIDPRDEHAKSLVGADGDLLLSAGTISLQSESHPVHFRKVELLPLNPDAK